MTRLLRLHSDKWCIRARSHAHVPVFFSPSRSSHPIVFSRPFSGHTYLFKSHQDCLAERRIFSICIHDLTTIKSISYKTWTFSLRVECCESHGRVFIKMSSSTGDVFPTFSTGFKIRLLSIHIAHYTPKFRKLWFFFLAVDFLRSLSELGRFCFLTLSNPLQYFVQCHRPLWIALDV